MLGVTSGWQSVNSVFKQLLRRRPPVKKTSAECV